MLPQALLSEKSHLTQPGSLGVTLGWGQVPTCLGGRHARHMSKRQWGVGAVQWGVGSGECSPCAWLRQQ